MNSGNVRHCETITFNSWRETVLVAVSVSAKPHTHLRMNEVRCGLTKHWESSEKILIFGTFANIVSTYSY